MTSRERLLAVLHGELPDCVPVCPDISNMVPCRLTGKPFWDIYAKQDPPLWKAHIDALKYYDLDGGFEIYQFGDVDPLTGERSTTEERVVHRYADGRFVIEGVPDGEYAVTVFQDLNENGELDTSSIGFPREPYGFSNDARGSFGPPKFRKAKFDVAGNTSISIELDNDAKEDD